MPTVQQGQIRPIVLAVIRRDALAASGGRDASILVFEGYDDLKGETFYRPLGGGIHFGEDSRAALVREMREELGAELAGLRYLATLENIFTYRGGTGHEIVVLYEARLTDPGYYQQDVVTFQDDGVTLRATWQPLSFFRAGRALLYPTGLLELLSTDAPAA